MTFADALKGVEDAAAALALVAPDVSSGKGKAFEAWALLSIARNLSDKGHGISALGCDDLPVSLLIVRGGPGHMPSSSADPTSSPSHILVTERHFGRECELHLGLKHASSNGPTHELDLSALPQFLASRLRQGGGGVYRGSVLGAAELKAYDAKYKLDQVFPRALLGTMVDLQPSRMLQSLRIAHFDDDDDKWGDGVTSFWSPVGWRASMHVVTTTALYDNSRRLLERHGGSSVENLDPSKDWARLEATALRLVWSTS